MLYVSYTTDDNTGIIDTNLPLSALKYQGTYGDMEIFLELIWGDDMAKTM